MTDTTVPSHGAQVRADAIRTGRLRPFGASVPTDSTARSGAPLNADQLAKRGYEHAAHARWTRDSEFVASQWR